MRITLEQAENTAAQAKLDLNANELTRLAGQLQEFLDYVNVLTEIPAVTAEPEGAKSCWTDLAGQEASCLRQEEVVALAPDSWQGLVRVPRVIEHE
jgi:aspartyl/glutamyl-tRNA(Asn/Gln) amidotransferase C subunit